MENDPVFNDIEQWADATRRAQGLPVDGPVVLIISADAREHIGSTLESELHRRHIRIVVES